MNTLPVSGALILCASILLGIIGDLLLRSPGAPGVNLFLWILAMATAALLLKRHGRSTLSAESASWLGIGVLFAAVLAWRDAPALKVVALATAAVAFALPAYRAGAAWVRGSGVAEHVLALVGAWVHAAFGGALAVLAVDWGELRGGSRGRPAVRRTLAAVRGVALATPFIIVFGGLFITADAVFARIVADTLRIDLPTLASHVFFAGFVAWIATGALSGFLAGTRLPVIASAVPRGGALGITEIAVALGMLAVLFGAFVIVQFRYLFGGSELVAVTPTLTYAEYARRGFFELVAVVALTLPVLLCADWLLRRDRHTDVRVFRLLAGVQVALVLAVAASALQRMRLYLGAYGLTESRFYATALLFLLVVVLIWFGATVLRGRRRSFAFGTVAAALAAAAVLVAINPDALIARTNIERALARDDSQPRFDVVYATSLSADAVPVLIDALPSLTPAAQCGIAKRLLQRLPPDASVDWRSWSWSSHRARAEIARHAGLLRSLSAGC